MGRSRSRTSSTTPPTLSSSINSRSDPLYSSSSMSPFPPRPHNDHDASRSTYHGTNLTLGLEGVSRDNCVPLVVARREKKHDWPLIKPFLRSKLAKRFSSNSGRGPCLFVKVHIEGVLIGRKLDLLTHHDYDELVTTLARMFKTIIHIPGECAVDDGPEKIFMLTYEDKDVDWMMVGDVPWKMKRLIRQVQSDCLAKYCNCTPPEKSIRKQTHNLGVHNMKNNC